MTNNFTAAANTQPAYQSVNEFVSHAESLGDSMLQIGRLVQGLGPSDRSSNFMIAQK